MQKQLEQSTFPNKFCHCWIRLAISKCFSFFFFFPWPARNKAEHLPWSASLYSAPPALFMARLLPVNRVGKTAQSAGVHQQDQSQTWQNNPPPAGAFKSIGGREMSRKWHGETKRCFSINLRHSAYMWQTLALKKKLKLKANFDLTY